MAGRDVERDRLAQHDHRLSEVEMKRQRMPLRGRDGGLSWYLQNAENGLEQVGTQLGEG